MRRISIDVTPEQHAKLKALAALKGKSIKDFVLACTIGNHAEDRALSELETLLDERIERAKSQGMSTRTVRDIFQQARDEAKRKPSG